MTTTPTTRDGQIRRDVRRAGLAEDDFALTVAVGLREAVTTVHVTGEIDSLTGGELEAVLYEQVADRPVRLVVDLSRVAALGSTGLAILARAKDVCRERGVELSLAGSGRTDLVRQLKITGLERLLVGTTSGPRRAPHSPEVGVTTDLMSRSRPTRLRPADRCAGPRRRRLWSQLDRSTQLDRWT